MSAAQVTSGRVTPSQERSIAALGGYVTRHLPLVDSVAVRIPVRSADRLAALPFVRHVSQDAVVAKNDVFTVDSSEADAALKLYPTLSGEGVTIAVVDSSVHPVDDLKDPVTGNARIIATRDFVGGSTSPEDKCGHGMHVAGITGGNGYYSSVKRDPAKYFQMFTGIAPRSKIVNVRVLNEHGEGTVSAVIKGID